MKRTLPLLLVIAILAACSQPGSIPSCTPTSTSAMAIGTPTETVTESPTETATATRTSTSTSTATTTPSPTITHVPPTVTTTPTVDSEALDDLKRGYLTLVYLEAVIGGLDELATSLQAGEITSIEAGMMLLALGSLLASVGEVLSADPPDPCLAAAWLDGQASLAIARDVVADWFEGKITSAEAPDLLAPASKSADRALEKAGSQMTREYGVPRGQMVELRETAEAGFREIVGTPTPDPGA